MLCAPLITGGVLWECLMEADEAAKKIILWRRNLVSDTATVAVEVMVGDKSLSLVMNALQMRNGDESSNNVGEGSYSEES